MGYKEDETRRAWIIAVIIGIIWGTIATLAILYE